MKARTALLELFKESSGWRAFFSSCCETSGLRLRLQAWQFRDELTGRGHEFASEEVEDILLGLARELLPNSPAARWDAEWARRLCEATIARLNERHVSFSAKEKVVVDTSPEADWIGRMNAAAKANDPAAFRAAVKGWERAGLEAMEQVRIKGGAA
jgi:hypothetical protein